MTIYKLMHKDNICGQIAYDETSGKITAYKDYHTEHSPFLGNADLAKIKKWWKMRSVPASRSALDDMLKKAGCINAGSYLAKNLALSMTDCYWICQDSMDLMYDEVKLSNLSGIHNGKIPYHNATSYDPNASLGGQMDKYWDLSEGNPVLVKESYRFFGQQSINELFATKVHEMQGTDIPFVKYRISIAEDRGILCRCDAFTSENVEFVPAYEIVESQKQNNEKSLYDSYIDICASNGIDHETMQNFMDYQTLTDFIISNTDEHLLNFGILRDPDSMRFIAPAPIFDSGNSMFYSDMKRFPDTTVELLRRKVTSFYKKEEQLLKKVQNKNIVDLGLLPEERTVKDLYSAFGIPEWKVDVICKNYHTKIQLAHDFQHGKTISLYIEKQKEREKEHSVHTVAHGQKFIMLCGISGSGKTKLAEALLHRQNKSGKKTIAPDRFCSVDDAIKKMKYFVDTDYILKSVVPRPEYSNTTTLVSLNEIKNGIENNYGVEQEDAAFAIAGATVKAALISGATVIYDASNLGKETREFFSKIAVDAGVDERELHVLDITPEQSEQDMFSLQTLEGMRRRLVDSNPSYSEGWTSIFQNEEPVHFVSFLEAQEHDDLSL